MVDAQPVLAEGSRIDGIVTDATHSGKVKGRAHVSVRFDPVTPAGTDEQHRIETASVRRTTPATKKDDATNIGAPAADSAIVGGGKWVAIGATAGAVGTAVVLSTRGKEVRLPVWSVLRIRLTEPSTMRIRG